MLKNKPDKKKTKNLQQNIIQRQLAEVKPQSHGTGVALTSTAAGSGGELKMYNPLVPEGQEVKNDVGFSGILDKTKWGTVGQSPEDYHRAHGYAKSFGGAGGKTNVGWWPASIESSWTIEEQKVAGWDGQAQVAGYKPGNGEAGTYKVERTDQAPVKLQKVYKEGVEKGLNWGFDDTRDAWQRAENKGDGVNYEKTDIQQKKSSLKSSLGKKAEQFVKGAFAEAESNLIDSMTMTYTRTTAGNSPNASRGNHTATFTAPAIDTTEFGLVDNPEEIWKNISSMSGIFGEKPAKGFQKQLNIKVNNKQINQPELMLEPQDDGWGVS